VSFCTGCVCVWFWGSMFGGVCGMELCLGGSVDVARVSASAGSDVSKKRDCYEILV